MNDVFEYIKNIKGLWSSSVDYFQIIFCVLSYRISNYVDRCLWSTSEIGKRIIQTLIVTSAELLEIKLNHDPNRTLNIDLCLAVSGQLKYAMNVKCSH